jgi:hypothetical protein
MREAYKVVIMNRKEKRTRATEERRERPKEEINLVCFSELSSVFLIAVVVSCNYCDNFSDRGEIKAPQDLGVWGLNKSEGLSEVSQSIER